MAKKTNHPTLSSVLLEALRADLAARTYAQISEETGIAQPILNRWVTGVRPDIRLSTAETLARYYGLVLVPADRPAPAKSPPKSDS